MDTERVEFVDTAVSGAGGDEVLDTGGPGDRRPGRSTLLLVGAVVVAVAVALLVGRVAGGDDARSTPTASSSPGFVRRPAPPVTTPVFGVVGMPPVIGSPRTLVTTQVGDVVWMVDQGAGIVRIENGVVTARQLMESQVTTIAVSPSGDRLYVATGAGRPSVQVLDGTDLSLGRSRPIEGSIQAMAVSIDAVWAASGSRLFRLDLDSLLPLATLAMPGAVLTTHLRITTEQSSGNQEIVAGLVTGSTGNEPTTTHALWVDPIHQQVVFGPVLPNDVQVANSPYLTWFSSPGADGTGQVTRGYESTLDPQAQAVATPPVTPGSRIYDGGAGFAAFLVVAPGSSVIGCRDPGGAPTSEVDLGPSVPDAIITGQVLRTSSAFYAVTDHGLVRSGVGDCT